MHTMRSVALLAVLTACTDYDLDEIAGEMVALIEVDVGAPVEFVSRPGALLLDFDEPDRGCFFLDESADLLVDGVRGERTVIEGKTHAGCDGIAFFVGQLPAPRDVSTIELVDDTARLQIRVPQLLVNPPLEATGPLQRGTTATIRVLDERPIDSAAIFWQPTGASGPEWRHYNPDLATPGELRFPVPFNANTGTGTLGVSVTIRHFDGSQCPDLAGCLVHIIGGGELALSIQ
jgi:hypothetical protein